MKIPSMDGETSSMNESAILGYLQRMEMTDGKHGWSIYLQEVCRQISLKITTVQLCRAEVRARDAAAAATQRHKDDLLPASNFGNADDGDNTLLTYFAKT